MEANRLAGGRLSSAAVAPAAVPRYGRRMDTDRLPDRTEHEGGRPRRRRAGTRAPLSDEHARGRRDGLRLALAVLAAEEERWAALLDGSRSGRTNLVREVRHKALRVAQARLRTALNRLSPRGEASSGAELAAALEEVGL